MFVIRAQVGKPQMRIFQGEDHAVIPVIALIEGVMQASNSPRPELVREEQMTKTVMTWNGRPVVVDHPEKRGVKISANSPDVLEKEQIGFIFNARISGKKLKLEAWINVENTTGMETRILEVIDRLLNEDVVEVSTGFFADTDENSGEFEGEHFDGVLTNIMPDHLAILSSAKGACSIEDGCGANRMNMSCKCGTTPCSCAPEPISAEDVSGVMKWLQSFGNFITNKEHGDRSDEDTRHAIQSALDEKVEPFAFIVAVFSESVVYATPGGLFRRAFEISEDGSVTLGEDIEAVRPETEFVPVRVNKENDMDKTKLVDGLITNEATQFTEESREWLMSLEADQLTQMVPIVAEVTEVTEPEPEPEPTESSEEDEEDDPRTAEEYIADAPEEVQEVLNQGLRLQKEHRNTLTTAIKANAKNQFDDTELASFALEQLEKLANLSTVKDFSGKGGPRAITASDSDAPPVPPEAFPETSQSDAA